jgi:succinate dehydrogenase / fumarate reductase, cytochrome b subunit
VLTVILTKENAAARQDRYAVKKYRQASGSSRIMIWTGLTLLAFIIYHLLHFTVRVNNNYDTYKVMLHGEKVHDVYRMVIAGFSWVPASLFYIISMALLCSHLAHGSSSLFQSLGLSNERLRPLFGKIGWALAVIIFLGNISIPIAVLAGLVK